MVFIPQLVTAAAALLSIVSAHPGHDAHQEAMERRSVLQHFEKRSLSHCADSLNARGLTAKSVARREALAHSIRERDGITHKRMLSARDFNTTLATDHHSSLTNLTADTDPSVLFGNNASCTLSPDVTQGPYYIAGEHIRNDIREDQAGVTLYMDVELLDIETCEPLANTWADFWHANSTGIYGGVVLSINGNPNDTANINTTFLRGVAPTDQDGVVQMTTVFPGHYFNRATHIHILVHSGNITINPNGTVSGSTAMHVGQIFFDQSLRDEVEALAPYNKNTQTVTDNDVDPVLEAATADDDDPVMEYVLLGDTLSDGLLAWIKIGVNTSASHYYDVSPAGVLTEEGGVANPNLSIIPQSGIGPSSSSTATSSSTSTASTAA